MVKSPSNLKGRLARTLTSILAILALALGVVASSTVVAEAAASCSFKIGKTYPGGPGHSSTVRAGVWKCGSHKGFCPEFGKRLANSTAVKSISKVPGMSASESHRAMWLANEYYNTNSPQTAADVAFAIWSLQGDSAFKKWYKWAKSKNYVTNAQVERVNALLNDSKHWDMKLTVKLTPVFIGKTGTGSVTVLDGTGAAVVGATPKVELSSNATFVTKPGTTDNKGVSSFTFKPTDVGSVTAKASLSGPSGKKALLTKSSAGRQRIVVGGVKATYRASASFEKRLSYELKTVCNSDCEGVAKVTFKASMESAGVPVRYTFSTGSKVWATFDLAPGQTITQIAQIPDGTMVSGKYAFINKVGGTVISKSVSLGKAFEVICPPWLKVSFTGDCDCNGAAGITLKLAAPGGTRYYQAVVQKNGKTVATKKLGKSDKSEVSVVMVHGDRVVVSFTAYRSPYKGVVLKDTPFDFTRN